MCGISDAPEVGMSLANLTMLVTAPTSYLQILQTTPLRYVTLSMTGKQENEPRETGYGDLNVLLLTP